jgi:hypothetical protein
MDQVSRTKKKNKRRYSPHLISNKSTGVIVPLHTNRMYGRIDLYNSNHSYRFEALRSLYVPPGLTIKISSWFSHCVYVFVLISQQTAILALYNVSRFVVVGSRFCITEIENVLI